MNPRLKNGDAGKVGKVSQISYRRLRCKFLTFKGILMVCRSDPLDLQGTDAVILIGISTATAVGPKPTAWRSTSDADDGCQSGDRQAVGLGLELTGCER
jgi:hypothetical protein